MVVVAPVLRFKDVGINANVNIKDLNTPDNLIAGALWQRQPARTGAGVCEKDVRRCTHKSKTQPRLRTWLRAPATSARLQTRVLILMRTRFCPGAVWHAAVRGRHPECRGGC